MRRDYFLVLMIIAGLAVAGLVSRAAGFDREISPAEFGEERLYLNGQATKRLTLSFNAVAADWYWLRSLQYVGRKIVAYEDAHEGRFDLATLSSLDLHLLPSLLRMSATLDPQFMQPYHYGAVILPEINSDEAIALLNQGIAANPSEWRLYQHLGYIYWQRRDYQQASQIYDRGSKLSGAPAWMAVMSGRMKAAGGSREEAREMYRHLSEASNDDAVKDMVAKQIMRLDSLDQQDLIRRALSAWSARTGHCPSSWGEIAPLTRGIGFPLEPNSLAPIDPSGAPYRLTKNGCDVELDEQSKVPKA